VLVDSVWNVMVHAQKPDFVFRRNGRVHLNRQERQFSRLLAAQVCASAVVMLDTTMFRGSVKGTACPLHSPVSPSLPLPCVTVCHYISTGFYPVRYSLRTKKQLIIEHVVLQSAARCQHLADATNAWVGVGMHKRAMRLSLSGL
jgi:hypothetical protein